MSRELVRVTALLTREWERLTSLGLSWPPRDVMFRRFAEIVIEDRLSREARQHDRRVIRREVYRLTCLRGATE